MVSPSGALSNHFAIRQSHNDAPCASVDLGLDAVNMASGITPVTKMRKVSEKLTETTRVGIGARIRSVRLRLDRTEREFAALLGVTSEIEAKWERGDGINRNVLVRIADATGTAIEWLIAGLSACQLEAAYAAAVRNPSAASDSSERNGDPKTSPTGSTPPPCARVMH